MLKRGNKSKTIHYGWVILCLIFGNLFVEGGVRNTQPVFLPALRRHFGGSAAMTSAVFSASGIVSAFAAPILGRFLDRIGPRYMFPIAGTVILFGWWASSFAGQTWQLFVFYSLIATVGHTAIGSFREPRYWLLGSQNQKASCWDLRILEIRQVKPWSHR